jgi:predicted RNA-binding Zn-ribbon protein involved in translation (DUF1610 family)
MMPAAHPVEDHAMQVEADQSVCPACGANGLDFFPVLHHLICAYIGPEYDFIPAAAGYACPKCRHAIVADDDACEIVGTSARCRHCGQEMVVSPPPPEAAASEAARAAPAAPAPRARRMRRMRRQIDRTIARVARRLSFTRKD